MFIQVSADEIRGGAVCKKKIELNSTDAASRAAAVAEYVGKEVLICGGRNRDAQVNEVTIFGTHHKVGAYKMNYTTVYCAYMTVRAKTFEMVKNCCTCTTVVIAYNVYNGF